MVLFRFLFCTFVFVAVACGAPTDADGRLGSDRDDIVGSSGEEVADDDTNLDDPGDGSPGTDDDGSRGDLSAFAQSSLDAHNTVRAGVGVAPLQWDPALEVIAREWATGCSDAQPPAGLIDHNAGRSDGHPTYVGENIFGSSGPSTAEGAATSWASEAADYDYNTNSCAPGRVCGHYTQMVWAATTHLGCASAVCSDLAYGHVIVCNYGPGGNIQGQSPY